MSTEAFNINFKNMLLYIGKAATQVQGCPMTSMILSELIRWLFDDPSRASQILDRFRENRINIHKRYASGEMESPHTSYEDALSGRDRSLYKHIDLFPGTIANRYTSQITWFSNFLASGMDDRYMSIVWKYMDKLDKQAGPVIC